MASYPDGSLHGQVQHPSMPTANMYPAPSTNPNAQHVPFSPFDPALQGQGIASTQLHVAASARAPPQSTAVGNNRQEKQQRGKKACNLCATRKIKVKKHLVPVFLF